MGKYPLQLEIYQIYIGWICQIISFVGTYQFPLGQRQVLTCWSIQSTCKCHLRVFFCDLYLYFEIILKKKYVHYLQSFWKESALRRNTFQAFQLKNDPSSCVRSKTWICNLIMIWCSVSCITESDDVSTCSSSNHCTVWIYTDCSKTISSLVKSLLL